MYAMAMEMEAEEGGGIEHCFQPSSGCLGIYISTRMSWVMRPHFSS